MPQTVCASDSLRPKLSGGVKSEAKRVSGGLRIFIVCLTSQLECDKTARVVGKVLIVAKKRLGSIKFQLRLQNAWKRTEECLEDLFAQRRVVWLHNSAGVKFIEASRCLWKQVEGKQWTLVANRRQQNQTKSQSERSFEGVDEIFSGDSSVASLSRPFKLFINIQLDSKSCVQIVFPI